MCGRYYIAEDDPDMILAGYVAEAQRRADTMHVPFVASGALRTPSAMSLCSTREAKQQPTSRCFAPVFRIAAA